MKHQRGFGGILLLIVVALAMGYGVYTYSKNETPPPVMVRTVASTTPIVKTPEPEKVKPAASSTTPKVNPLVVANLHVPAEFNDGVAIDIPIVGLYGSRQTYTHDQKSERMALWNNLLTKIREKISCEAGAATSTCEKVHLAGSCQGVYIWAKKGYSQEDVAFYSKVWNYQWREFPTYTEC